MSNLSLKRIQHDVKELIESSINCHKKLYHIEPVNDNLLSLKGYIVGPKDTPYENGQFHVEIKMPEDYPFKPPKIRFTTRIWHQNISYDTGAICLGYLTNKWSPSMTLKNVVLSIRNLLESPESGQIIKPEIGKQFIENPNQFRQIARFWTYYYATDKTEKEKKRKNFEEYEEKLKKLCEKLNGLDKDFLLQELSLSNWNTQEVLRKLKS